MRRHGTRILLLAALGSLPGVAFSLHGIWHADLGTPLTIVASSVAVLLWLLIMFAIRHSVVRPLQTAANLLAALRQEDFTIEGRSSDRHDALGLLFAEINELRAILRHQRLGAIEATTLLRKVTAEMDVPIFAFDEQHTIRFANRAAERLLRLPQERLLGQPADQVGLACCLEGETRRVLHHTFAGGSGRWDLRRSRFRQDGRLHELVILSDLSRVLQAEERHAWRRLIRVISHEINNSLAPIKSIAGSLTMAVDAGAKNGVNAGDLREGLRIIAERAGSLQRFMASYAQLAKLPAPVPRPTDIAACVRRVAAVETRLRVEVVAGAPLVITADTDQIEQVLINLLKNAADAALEGGGKVQIGWEARGAVAEISIVDDGPGLTGGENLFVPFFTTKADGSGIGLTLCRQIAEAHGGTLTLSDRGDPSGCRATLILPCRPER